MNCSTILWLSVSQGQLLGNMSLTEVCGSLTKAVKPSLILGSSQWRIQTLGGGGWSSRPWYKGLGRGLEKKNWPIWPQFVLEMRGAAPCLLGSATASMKWTALLQTFTWSQRCQNPNNSYLCYVDDTQSLWNPAMCSNTELPCRKNLTLVSNVDKAVLGSLFWPSQWTMNSMNF